MASCVFTLLSEIGKFEFELSSNFNFKTRRVLKHGPLRPWVLFSQPRGWIQAIKQMSPVLLMHGLFLSYTQNLIIHRSYITVFTHGIWLMLTQPLASYCPLFLFVTLISATRFFTYLENQLSCSWCEYPSTLVPGLLSTAHPLLLLPLWHTP
jgi:hypothetical protein